MFWLCSFHCTARKSLLGVQHQTFRMHWHGIFALLLFIHEESRNCKIDNDTLYLNKIDVIFALHASGAGYIDSVFEIVEEAVESNSSGASCITTLPVPPPPLASSFGPVDKAVLVREHLSRFASTPT